MGRVSGEEGVLTAVNINKQDFPHIHSIKKRTGLRSQSGAPIVSVFLSS
jgi:hypothetical protein